MFINLVDGKQRLPDATEHHQPIQILRQRRKLLSVILLKPDER